LKGVRFIVEPELQRGRAMKSDFSIDTPYLKQTLERLIGIPSPTGSTLAGIAECRRILCEFPNIAWDLEVTPKGILRATCAGEQNDAPRAVTAHIDTLGALVKRIKPNGRLQMAQIGSFDWTAIENETVTIETYSGETFRGTVLFVDDAYHLHSANDRPEDKARKASNVEIRLDARTSSEEDTRKLGIEVGDFVHFDTRYQESNGFIHSRFLDDKACLACVFTALKFLSDNKREPAQRLTIHISNYEEVCHGGAAGFPHDVHEVLAVDVAPVGSEQNSDEYSCSLCLLDDDGPYDETMNRRLRSLAQQNNIPLRPDIYKQYASDAKALWKAGADVRAACIGPGVDATHGYERTNITALEATTRLIIAYLLAA
jgi:putative aminopeptidase FrvX